MKAGSMGISIRRSQAPQTEKAAPAAQATAAIPQADANWKIISLMKKTSTTTGVNLPPAFRKKKQQRRPHDEHAASTAERRSYV